MLRQNTFRSAQETRTAKRQLAFVSGLGVSLPQHRVSNEEVATGLADMSAAGIESRTGIRQRYFASHGQKTSDLAVEASRAAIQQADVEAGDIDLVLLATATPDHFMPATACRVQYLLGAHRAAAMDLVAACSGFIYALWVGQQFIESGQANCVLVVGAEVMSRIVDPSDRQCAILFGDGAGAAVLTRSKGPYRLGRFWAKSYGEQYPLLLREGGAENPLTPELVAQGKHFMRMDGRRVFRAAVAGFCEAIRETATVNELGLEELEWIIPHQANNRIFSEVADRLGLDLGRFWLNVARYGNTVAASIPLALEQFHREVGPRPHSRLLLACVGAGMTVGGTMLWVD